MLRAGSSLVRCRILAGMSALALTFGVLGCGAGKPPEGIVKGAVTYNGKPLADVQVEMEQPGAGIGALATTDAEGKFTVEGQIRTGSYKVTIGPKAEAPPEPGVTPKKIAFPPIPKKYRQMATTDLSMTVVEGENDVKLELKD